MAREQEWFAVRCVFRQAESSEWQPPDLKTGDSAYEERITLWRGTSLDDAIAQAEAEAAEYAATQSFTYAGLAQAFRLFDEPGHGAEVFSLMRYSPLPSDAYLNRYFDDGSERQQNAS